MHSALSLFKTYFVVECHVKGMVEMNKLDLYYFVIWVSGWYAL